MVKWRLHKERTVGRRLEGACHRILGDCVWRYHGEADRIGHRFLKKISRNEQGCLDEIPPAAAHAPAAAAKEEQQQLQQQKHRYQELLAQQRRQHQQIVRLLENLRPTPQTVSVAWPTSSARDPSWKRNSTARRPDWRCTASPPAFRGGASKRATTKITARRNTPAPTVTSVDLAPVITAPALATLLGSGFYRMFSQSYPVWDFGLLLHVLRILYSCSL